MPSVDLIDETFLAAEPALVAAFAHDPAALAAFWPDLELTTTHDRGLEGVRWAVTGALVGTAEMWVEPMLDGALLHVYLRAEVTERGHPTRARPAGSPRAAVRETGRRARAVKLATWRWKAELEAGRAAGEPPVTG